MVVMVVGSNGRRGDWSCREGGGEKRGAEKRRKEEKEGRGETVVIDHSREGENGRGVVVEGALGLKEVKGWCLGGGGRETGRWSTMKVR